MRRLTLVPTLGVLLVACGGGAGPPSTDSSPGGSPSVQADGEAAASLPDPCALLTRDEIAAVIGHDVSQGTPNPAYTVVDDTNQVCGYDALLLIVDVSAGYDKFKEIAELGVEEQNGVPVEPVSGVGEEAYWDPNFWQMGARQGEYFVGVAFIEPAELATLRGWGEELLSQMLQNL